MKASNRHQLNGNVYWISEAVANRQRGMVPRFGMRRMAEKGRRKTIHCYAIARALVQAVAGEMTHLWQTRLPYAIVLAFMGGVLGAGVPVLW